MLFGTSLLLLWAMVICFVLFCFGEDAWREEVPFSIRFPRLYKLSLVHNAPISYFASSHSYLHSWDLKLFRNLNERECVEFASLMSLVEGVFLRSSISDQRKWIADSSGVFSCKSFFEALNNFPSIPKFLPSLMI